MTSIRLRLLLLFLGLTLLAWGATVGSTYWQTSHEVEEIYDAHLVQSAGELLILAAHEQAEQGRVYDTQPFPYEIREITGKRGDDEYAPRLRYRVWAEERLLLRSSDSGPDSPVGPPGFGMRHDADGLWRVYTLRDPGEPFAVEVAERLDIRSKIADEVALASIYPALMAFPVIAVLAWFAVGGGLAPLRYLARQVGNRTPESLTPVSLAATPYEVLPLVNALNRLLAKLQGTLERERRFTADASHELRTPLAGLKVQAQVAARASDPDERNQALAQIIEGVDRSNHLIEQLLTIARLDPADADGSCARMNLNEVAAETVAQLTPAAARKHIDLGLRRAEVGEVQGRPEMVAVLLRNLIDNAVRYTPAGGRVEVRIRDAEGQVCLEVGDSGPGIPAEDRPRVFDRFYRGIGHQEPGCGLGLSIVQRITELHRARLDLVESPFGGLGVVVCFRR